MNETNHTNSNQLTGTQIATVSLPEAASASLPGENNRNVPQSGNGDSRSLTDFTGLNTFFISLVAEIPSHSSFASLSPEDHKMLLNWLIHHNLVTVRDLIAKPRPEGLAIQTSIMSLSRYRRKHLGEYLSACREQETGPVSDLSHFADSENPAVLENATLTSLRHRLFRMSLSDHHDPSRIRSLFMVFEKFRNQSLANSRADITQRLSPAKDGVSAETNQLKIDIEKLLGI